MQPFMYLYLRYISKVYYPTLELIIFPRDRVLSTSVECQWDYSPEFTSGRHFYDEIFDTVESTIYEIFAGPPIRGLHSSSVQNALYEIEKTVLQRVPEVFCNMQ